MIEVVWAPKDLFFIRNDLSRLYIKEEWGAKIQKCNGVVPECFVFCGAMLNQQIVIWAQPGISKEEYLSFFEYMQVRASASELLSCVFKCIQHALHQNGARVASALTNYRQVEEIAMDEF